MRWETFAWAMRRIASSTGSSSRVPTTTSSAAVTWSSPTALVAMVFAGAVVLALGLASLDVVLLAAGR